MCAMRWAVVLLAVCTAPIARALTVDVADSGIIRVRDNTDSSLFSARVLGRVPAAKTIELVGFDDSEAQPVLKPNSWLKLLGTPDFAVGAWLTPAIEGGGVSIGRVTFYRFGGETLRLEVAGKGMRASLTTSSGSVQQLKEGRLARIQGGMIWHKPPKAGSAAASVIIEQPAFSVRVQRPWLADADRWADHLDLRVMVEEPVLPQPLTGVLAGTLPPQHDA